MTTEEDAGIDPYMSELLIQNMELKARLANVQHEAKGVRMELSMFCESSDEVIARVKAMTAEQKALRFDLATLVKVLAFYANKENWQHQPHERVPLSKAMQDAGHLAREVLGVPDA